MWLFTPLGFFSATLTTQRYKELPPEQRHGHIMVRARVREDLERLIERYRQLPPLPVEGRREPEILALPGHDYPYRIVMPRAEWTTLAAALAHDIDYSNFKNAVERKAPTAEEGHARHDLYMKVWRVMNGAERWLRDHVTKSKSRRQGGFSYWQQSVCDPRSDADMQAMYSRGYQEWLDEDGKRAVVSELPEGTDRVFDVDEVIDNPTPDDIARFEAAVSRPPRRRRGRR